MSVASGRGLLGEQGAAAGAREYVPSLFLHYSEDFGERKTCVIGSGVLSSESLPLEITSQSDGVGMLQGAIEPGSQDRSTAGLVIGQDFDVPADGLFQGYKSCTSTPPPHHIRRMYR